MFYMLNSYIEAWNKYAVFKCRSRRKEYWVFTIINSFILIFLWLNFTSGIINGEPSFRSTGFLFSVVIVIPSLAVTARRLHDVNESGWIMLLSLIPIAY